MSPAALPMAELFLSLAALIGLVVLDRSIMAQDGWHPLNRRFVFGLRVAMLIYAGRAIVLLTGMYWVNFFVLLGAALVPLAVVLLTEGLVRRHAPRWVKLLVLGGSVLFGLAAFWLSDSLEPFRLLALLVYQISGLFIAGWLILSRNKSSLSAAENKQAERLGLSLTLLIPFAASDFLMDYIDLPVRPSALGVLFLCWLAVSLGAEHGRHRSTIARFAVLVIGTGLAGGFIAFLSSMTWPETFLTLMIIWSATLLATLWNDAHALQATNTRQSLLALLIEDHPNKAAFLAKLLKHPVLSGALQIKSSELADFDNGELRQLFNEQPVLTRAALPKLSDAAADHAQHLFARYDASHILLTGNEPLSLLALSMPGIGAFERAELEFALVQKMAVLMDEKT